MDATTLSNGDFFIGRIGRNGVTGFNKNGKPVDNSDGDAFTDSMEECINDALQGHCSTVGGTEAGVYDVTPLVLSKNQQTFLLEFLDVSGCALTECSDHAENDVDGRRDFGGAHGFLRDLQCSDYDDDDESS